MYATESSTRGAADDSVLDLPDGEHATSEVAMAEQAGWTAGAVGADEGGRGGATTVESPFKDPHQLQPLPPSGVTRLPSFATLTFPLNRNGTPAASTSTAQSIEGAPSSPMAGGENAQAGPSQTSPTTSSFDPSNGHFSSAAAQQIAQSSNYGNYYAEVDTHDSAASSVHDPSLLIDPSGLGPYDDDHNAAAELGLSLLADPLANGLMPQQEEGDGGGLNPSVKRARGNDDRESSAGSTGGSGSPNPAKTITTQKTRDAGMTRRKTEARFTCPVDGCGSTFTRSVPPLALSIRGPALIMSAAPSGRTTCRAIFDLTPTSDRSNATSVGEGSPGKSMPGYLVWRATIKADRALSACLFVQAT